MATTENLKTAPFDARFPNQNQTRNCWQNYVDYYRCKAKKGENYENCNYFKKIFGSLCPNEWNGNSHWPYKSLYTREQGKARKGRPNAGLTTSRQTLNPDKLTLQKLKDMLKKGKIVATWDEQRENGCFPGKI